MTSKNGDILRATATIAKTFYRELRRADYSHRDVLRLVNEMVELLTRDARASGGGESTWTPSQALDEETGLGNAEVMDEVLAFEYRHVHQASGGGGGLQILALDVELPGDPPAEVCRRFHQAFAGILRACVRATETIGRLSPTRYLIVLPRCPAPARVPVARRLATSLAGLEAEGTAPPGTRIWARFAGHDAEVASSAALLERATSADPQQIFPAPRQPLAATQERQLVLALGGRLAPALAHLGVLRALRRAGIQVAGIAGTSGGALVGAMIAAGLDDVTILERFAELARSEVYRQVRQIIVGIEQRRARGTSPTFAAGTGEWASVIPVVPEDLHAALVEILVGPDREIASLPIPFAAVTTDLVTGQLVARRSGSLHAALRASSAIMGVFAAVSDGDRRFVDGSVLADLPIAAAGALCPGIPVGAVVLQRDGGEVATFADSADPEVLANTLARGELTREQLSPRRRRRDRGRPDARLVRSARGRTRRDPRRNSRRPRPRRVARSAERLESRIDRRIHSDPRPRPPRRCSRRRGTRGPTTRPNSTAQDSPSAPLNFGTPGRFPCDQFVRLGTTN